MGRASKPLPFGVVPFLEAHSSNCDQRVKIFTNVDQLLSFTFELLQSILGERSENVVRSYAKRGEVHGKEIPSLAKWVIRS